MFVDTIGQDDSYYHAVHRKVFPHYGGPDVPEWGQVVAKRGVDRRTERRRFARADTGTMYFGESAATVGAELRLPAAPARLHLYVGGGTTAKFWLYEARFRAGCQVLSVRRAEETPANRQAFAARYGADPVACLDPDDYAASHDVAKDLTHDLKGVSYPSVRRTAGHCLAMYAAEDDVDHMASSGEL